MLSSLPHSGCLGVILAGGASRRMGHDKATLPWGNSTLLDHMRALLFKAGVDRVVILGKPDVEDGVADETPFSGPVPALLSYLRAAGAGQRHVVVPIDMPYLSPALLAPLASVTHWTRYDGYVFPFTAIGGEIVSGSGPRLRDLLSANKATLLTVPAFADRAFRNLNHLGDLPYSHPAHANERCCQ